MKLECCMCGNELNGEEAESPRLDDDGDHICDDCYHDHYEFTCCVCEEYEETSHQHVWLVVFDAEGAGVDRGIYRIVNFPYYCDYMIGADLYGHALRKVREVPNDHSESPHGYSCGHVCRRCADNLKLTTPEQLTR